MKARYVRGYTRPIDYTPSGAVAAGDVVIREDLVGVAPFSIAANALGVLYTEGVFEVEKITEEAFDQGETVYWDPTGVPASDPEATDGAASVSPEGGTPFGFVAEAATQDALTALIQLQQTAVAAS